jgi:chorismate mutase / prephenate dehydratase
VAERRPDDVARLRRRIDALDRRLVSLLNERASLALEIDEHRSRGGRQVVRDPGREAEVISRVRAANRGPLPADDLVALYQRLLSLTRRLQTSRRLPSAASEADDEAQDGGEGGSPVPDR